jgi:hypothetical protein
MRHTGIKSLPKLLVLFVPILLSGCEKPSPSPKFGTPQYEAAQVGDRIVAERFPYYDRSRNPIIVEDDGENWGVRYRLPKGVFGGTPTVILNKKTLKPVRVYETQ